MSIEAQPETRIKCVIPPNGTIKVGAMAVCLVMVAFVALAPLMVTAQAPASHASNVDSTVPQAPAAAMTDESAEIAQKLTNPLTAMISIPIQSWFDFNLGPNKDGFRYTMEAQPVYPMQISKEWNLLSRTTIPFVYQQNLYGRTSQIGLSDATESLFLSPVHTKSFIWGAGPIFLVPTGTNGLLSTRKFSIGPTAIVLEHKGHTNIGLLASQVWSVAGSDSHPDVSQTYAQPFLAYTTKKAWTYAMTSYDTYNWEVGRWTAIVNPIRVMYGRCLGLRTFPIYMEGGQSAGSRGLIMMFTAPQTEAGPMQTLTIEVTQDHIDRLSKAKKPVLGIAELIWNSVDADATIVDVRLNRNGLGSLDSIEVIDNGLGITMPDAQEGFGHLGGSWKQHDHQTKREKRILHGRQGQGRFRAFALCERAEWDTTYLANGALAEYKIIGTSNDKRRFTITDETPSSRGGTGTTATLTNLIPQQTSLDGAKAVPELNKLFALYLKQYPQVRLSYDGDAVDPSVLEDTRTNYPLPAFTTEDGRSHEVTLTIIEWNIEIERGLYLCTEGGITLRELPPGIHAPGYRFTAYLRSKLLEEMEENGTIEMEEFTDLRKLLDITKEQMRRHFLHRDAEKASGVVEQWKHEDIYPYAGEPKDIIEETERQVFDVVAVNLDAYVEDFKESKPHSKKLTFTLLRYALESNPSSLNFILEQVVGLPKEMQDEFAALLQKTSLIAMINASKIVTERLDFLKGLEYLLYDPQSRATLKERSQLHKLISRNTWIFGDEFYLVNNDESLTNVLRKHVKNVAFEVDLDTPVLRETISAAIAATNFLIQDDPG